MIINKGQRAFMTLVYLSNTIKKFKFELSILSRISDFGGCMRKLEGRFYWKISTGIGKTSLFHSNFSKFEGVLQKSSPVKLEIPVQLDSRYRSGVSTIQIEFGVKGIKDFMGTHLNLVVDGACVLN